MAARARPARRSAYPLSSPSRAHAPCSPAGATRRLRLPESKARPTRSRRAARGGGRALRAAREADAVIRDTPVPIFSLLVSRHGKLVYEALTSSFDRDDAHLRHAGRPGASPVRARRIAIDRGLSPDRMRRRCVSSAPSLLRADAHVRALQGCDAEQAMGMALLTRPPPLDGSEAVACPGAFLSAPNPRGLRPRHAALGTRRLPVTTSPSARGRVVRTWPGRGSRFRARARFRPDGVFGNAEWMTRTRRASTTRATAVRLRPIDMQSSVFSTRTVESGGVKGSCPKTARRSSSRWVRSRPDEEKPTTGSVLVGARLRARLDGAHGRRMEGQRIGVFPEQDIVVTMTGVHRGW